MVKTPSSAITEPSLSAIAARPVDVSYNAALAVAVDSRQRGCRDKKNHI